MVAAIIFILILGVLIFVHEAGHFFIARRNGIKAEEFGFGFPPRIFGVQVLGGKDKKRKWRFIWGKRDTEKEVLDAENFLEGTIYSLNWIPLGGFVKIKGENGEGSNESDSFAAKGAWVRIKVLIAGVLMNFFLAWFLFFLVFMLGAPEAVDTGDKISPDSKIQIAEVVSGSPAETAGIKVGDEIIKNQGVVVFATLEDVQKYINSQKGQEVILNIKRGDENLKIAVVPRVSAPEGQGALGIGFVESALVSYPWYESIWKGLVTVFELTRAMLTALFQILKNIFLGENVKLDVAGPVGIAVLTKQVATLGLVYILQFAAILSINLGIINVLPFPALDGGRILFILIEKIKGSPVSQKTEQLFHTIGFLLLMLLMLVVTFKDVAKFIK